MLKIDWRKEAKDQAAHFLIGLLTCLIVHPTFWSALFIVAVIWACREHAQHGFNFTGGSMRDLVGWQAGALAYGLSLL